MTKIVLKINCVDSLQGLKLTFFGRRQLAAEFFFFSLQMEKCGCQKQGSKLTTNWSHMRLDFWLCA